MGGGCLPNANEIASFKEQDKMEEACFINKLTPGRKRMGFKKRFFFAIYVSKLSFFITTPKGRWRAFCSFVFIILTFFYTKMLTTLM